MKKTRIMLSKVKYRYAQKISVAYRLAEKANKHPMFSGMTTSFDTSFDQYCDILRQHHIIVDDTRRLRIKKI